MDLIPDPIPVLGYLDELVVLPLGVLLVRRLVPAEVLADCRQRAEAAAGGERRPRNWIAAGVVVALWIGTAAGVRWGCGGCAVADQTSNG